MFASGKTLTWVGVIDALPLSSRMHSDSKSQKCRRLQINSSCATRGPGAICVVSAPCNTAGPRLSPALSGFSLKLNYLHLERIPCGFSGKTWHQVRRS